jgi:hypothetical protein
VFLNIRHLFTSRISVDPNIPKLKNSLANYGCKNCPKDNILAKKKTGGGGGQKPPKAKHPFFFKYIFCRKYSSFYKRFPKNHKLIFQNSIAIIIITTNYNFEETSGNMSPEQF